MPWWGWLVIGAIFLVAELFIVEAEFFLVFLGVSALLTGLAVFGIPAMPVWVQWIVFAVVSLVSMVFFRKRVYGRLGKAVPDRPQDMVGDLIEVPQALAPGGTCRIEYRGTTWTARNDGAAAIPAGAKARVIGTQGITLQVSAA
ncbi:MAG: NfeD family protein [Gammaproteobacteria bacterium]|nr:NfeD family protein [Gammaproteobacteria bacterium]